ncbi:CidA/LrgA family protein [Gracilibacillus marinus]|jgi:holin-like protein|uniref:CidA/LrgA family protein n=1 Tax=Gracilibacillus marinus TaxID=630535 RepID=A0ABV8VXY9_9BACI
MKKVIKIVLQISVLFLFFYIGEWIQSSLSLIIPGSIIGMLLFLILLLTGIIPEKFIKDGLDLLLKDMPLFFIPVTVGIVNLLHVFAGKGLLMLGIALISTIIVIYTTGLLTQKIMGKEE